MPDERCIVTFPSTHFALRAERVAKKAGIAVRMIPVPRRLSSDCNIGMEAPVEEEKQLGELLADNGVECDFRRWRE